MILLDYSQTAISAIMVQLNSDPKQIIDEYFVRHIVLNTMRSYIKQYKKKFGDLVICCDSKTYWRRDFFPFYKVRRKKDRSDSKFDWNLIFSCINKIRDELKVNFPAKVLEVPNAEADDIIAVLAKRFAQHGDVLIISSDKDFLQLQCNKRIQQYSPALKRFIRTPDPHLFLKQHIIYGELGDSIPNILSPDNTYASGGRNKKLKKDLVEQWLKNDDSHSFCVTDAMKNNYDRNETLIDLNAIPVNVSNSIIEAYDQAKPCNNMAFMNYLVTNKLKSLIEVMDEFR